MRRISIILMLIVALLLITSCIVKESENTYSSDNKIDKLKLDNNIEKEISRIKDVNDKEDLHENKEVEAKEENAEIVKAEHFELLDGDLPADIINDIEYNVGFKVIPSDPKFNITLFGYNVQSYKLTSDKKSYYIAKDINHISRMIIVNEALDFYQELSFDETATPNIETFPYGLTFDDWNFDGYKDISLWIFQGGTSLNVPTYYWLWDNDDKKFVRNEKLTEISDSTYILIDNEVQQLVASQRYSNGHDNYDYYKWIDREIVFIKSVEVKWVFNEEDDSSVAWHIVREFVDGELKIVDEYIKKD